MNKVLFSIFGVWLLVLTLAFLAGFTPVGGLLTPPGGGLLSPGGGWQRSGTTTRLINESDVVGIGTSSDLTTNVTINDSGQGTSTLFVVSQFGTRGGCLQFEGPASTTFRLYATSSQLAYFESGTCR
mgnify:CR=1 FL=1